MNKLLVVGATILAIAGGAGLSTLTATAMNGSDWSARSTEATQRDNSPGRGYQASLESRAQIFGMSAADLEKALETKTMSQIAVEKGMSEEDFQSKMTEAAKARWEARGLSADEITERLAERKARHEANSADHEFGSGDGGRIGGYGRHRQ